MANARKGLTPRQRQCLRLIAQGHSTYEAAWRLGLKRVTVRNHLTRAMHNLGANSRLRAVVLALLRGELTLEDLRDAAA